MSALAAFLVDARPGGGQVVVNGVDITHQVSGLRLETATGQIPQLSVALIADGVIEGLGDVRVFHHPTDDLAGWLRSIDPAELEREALSRMGMGDSSATKMILDVLADWAQGKVGR